ncbi:MAG: helix-turn-helix domain-containing protein [Dehalococcoidia bacterium]|nr:helix-turn-helix domain-containing protein [Dehalococcoidia bacterium]
MSTNEPDIASTAALVGNPSRAAILAALLDGRALPAGELARAAGISPQTASSHLERLLAGNLLRVEIQGKHRYYRLRGYAVADLLELLSTISLPKALPERNDALARGRTCYGHLAGRLGVYITDAMRDKKLLGPDMKPTPEGTAWFSELGIEIGALKRTPLARPCLDWSERRHHLAGALGVALATRMFELRWLAKSREPRVVRLTQEGSREMRSRLGLSFDS